MHSLVGWAKALARDFPMARTLVRRAHAVIIRNCARTRGHGEREASTYGDEVPAPLPTLRRLRLMLLTKRTQRGKLPSAANRRTMGMRLIALTTLALLLTADLSHAQPQYPARTVRIVVPYPAGGGTDVLGRLLAD